MQPKDPPANKPKDSGGDSDPDKNAIEAIIGDSVKVQGDISGQADLIVNGTVEGNIDLRENCVIIGEKGRVNANVHAKHVIVQGEVKGELRGSVQVTIKPSGRVTGDIRAPRVVLDEGCQFKGSVDMEDKPGTPPGSRGAVARLGGAKPYAARPGDKITPRRP